MDRYKLGDICEIVSGSTPKTSIEEYWDGDVKWITPAELDNDSYIITDTVRKITDLAVKKTGLSSFPEGTVILSSRAPIGKVAIAGCEMYCNQGFKNLICSDKINNKYLYWFLKGNTEFLNSLGRGATFKEISKQIVANIEINIPDYDKQIEIAEQIEKVDEIIKLRKQELVKMDDLIKARFIEMFGDPVENPKGWDKRQLSDECEIITGNTPSRKKPNYYGDFIEWIKSDNINTPNALLTPAVEFLSEEGLKVGRSVEKDCILMTCIAGSIGCIGKVSVTDRKVAFNQQINGIIPNKNNVWFLYVLFDLSKSYIQSTVTMALKGILSKGQLSKIEFIFPPIELQNKFSEFVKLTDKSKLRKHHKLKPFIERIEQ